MAHVILGLLLITQQSLYDLVKNFEAGGSLLYSASAGSIKRALDSLLGKGLIEVATTEPGVRGRKTYRTTRAGREKFEEWMVAELVGGDAESAALHRFFFLGWLDPGGRVAVLQNIVARLQKDLLQLKQLSERANGIDVSQEHREIARFQLSTLEYGLEGHERSLAWFRRQLELAQKATMISHP